MFLSPPPLVKKRTCVLAVLQAGMMALEMLAFSATFPENFKFEQPKKKRKGVNRKIFCSNLPPPTRLPRMLFTVIHLAIENIKNKKTLYSIVPLFISCE